MEAPFKFVLDWCLKFIFFSLFNFPVLFVLLTFLSGACTESKNLPVLPRVPANLARALFPITHKGGLDVWLLPTALTYCEGTALARLQGLPLVLVENTEACSFLTRFEITRRVLGLPFKDRKDNRASNADQAVENISLFPVCLEIKLPSVLLFYFLPSCVDL